MRPLLALTAAAALAGCGVPAVEDGELESLEDGKYEAWDYDNKPAKVGENLLYDFAKLPLRGATRSVPIAGDYWATANDSVNYRWDGDTTMSPAEKVEKAFNLTGFAKYVTDNFGIYGHGRKECDTGSECEDLKD